MTPYNIANNNSSIKLFTPQNLIKATLSTNITGIRQQAIKNDLLVNIADEARKSGYCEVAE